MRQLALASFLLLSVASIAQVPFTREKVVEVDTVSTADALRAKARKWFVDTFRDANEVIQLDDPKLQMIVGKGWGEYGPHAGLHYTIEIACKPGRVKYRIYDVRHEGKGSVYVAGTYAPVPSWGPLFDEERCFTPQPSGLQGAAGAERQMLRTCEANRPEIAKRLDALASSIEQAMKAPAPSVGSDW